MTTRFIEHLLEGDHGSRPAFGDVPEGTLYACSDHALIYQSDGATAWSTWATLGGDVSAHTGDTADAHDASAISFTPAGSIAATDVQAAIEEVASEAGVGGGLSDDAKAMLNHGLLAYVAGNYYDGSFDANAPAGNGLNADTIYFSPFYAIEAFTADRIGVNVTAGAGAGESGRLGIYESDADGKPGALLLDAGTFSAATTGGKEITISQALSADTLYWLAIVTNNAFDVALKPFGGRPVLGLTSLAATVYQCAFTDAHTFGALPNPAVPVIGGSLNAPSIRLRVA